MDKQDIRIAAIFASEKPPEVDQESLEHYLDFLEQKLTLPCSVKNTERRGKGDLTLVALEPHIETHYGLFGLVKGGEIHPLVELEVLDQKSANYQLCSTITRFGLKTTANASTCPATPMRHDRPSGR